MPPAVPASFPDYEDFLLKFMPQYLDKHNMAATRNFRGKYRYLATSFVTDIVQPQLMRIYSKPVERDQIKELGTVSHLFFFA